MKENSGKVNAYAFVIAITSLILSIIALPFMRGVFKIKDELVLTVVSQIVAYIIPIVLVLYFTAPKNVLNSVKERETLYKLKRVYHKPRAVELIFSLFFAVILFFVSKFFNLFKTRC